MAPEPKVGNTACTICDTFRCGVCQELLLDPLTLICCGASFCCRCLHSLIRINVQNDKIPKCPAACGEALPFRLPACSTSLLNVINKVVPHEIESRRRQQEEMDKENITDQDMDSCYGGLIAWRDVVAARDIYFCNQIVVQQGTLGVVVGNLPDGRCVAVKFDERQDTSERCVHVLPDWVMPPLPGGFRLHQRVVASNSFLVNGDVAVRFGFCGIITGRHGEDHINVVFDERLDGGEGALSVHYHQIQAHRKFAGGFQTGQHVYAAMDLVLNAKVTIKKGWKGTILDEFSAVRVIVSFNSVTEGGNPIALNVLPHEIKTWYEILDEFSIGESVRAIVDLTFPNVADIEGLYIISSLVTVTPVASIAELAVTGIDGMEQLVAGTIVDIAEVRILPEEKRVRGRLTEKDGWISLLNLETNDRWAYRIMVKSGTLGVVSGGFNESKVTASFECNVPVLDGKIDCHHHEVDGTPLIEQVCSNCGSEGIAYRCRQGCDYEICSDCWHKHCVSNSSAQCIVVDRNMISKIDP